MHSSVTPFTTSLRLDSDLYPARRHRCLRVPALACARSAVTFHPTQQPILLSGGWDNTIQIFDTRAGSAVRSLYGAHICGDALSVTPDGRYVVSGSWRPDDALQVGIPLSHSLIQQVVTIGSASIQLF